MHDRIYRVANKYNNVKEAPQQRVIFTIINIAFYSYGLAFLAYTLLGAGIILIWRNSVLSLPVNICVALTAIWAGVVALCSLTDDPPHKLIESAEAARNSGWMCLLHALYGLKLRERQHFLAGRRWIPWFSAGMLLVLLWLYAMPWLLELAGLPDGVETDLNFLLWFGFSLAVIAWTEQIYRLSNETERWQLKYLCLALVFIYGYDLLMYTEAEVLEGINPIFWQTRGIVVAVVAPLFAISVSRGPKHTADLQASKHVVFHTFSLIAAGIYLIYMAAVGYALGEMKGTWSGVIQITFLSISGILFVVLVVSSRVRDLLRVWLSKSFFSYRFDYRREWLDFTQTMAKSEDSTPSAVVQAMAKICGSPAGLLWTRTDEGRFTLTENWRMDHPKELMDVEPLARWLEQTIWVIDLREWRESPELYSNLELSEELLEVPKAWLIIPLMFTDRLEGILLLCHPEVIPDINWEDRDLLKLAGRASATHLARYKANKALLELRQFEAFNSLSAYVLHDLKNILAQQSLIVFNKEFCRDDPEFIDDVFEAVESSVERLKRLMAQMRSGQRGGESEIVELNKLIKEAINSKKSLKPTPVFSATDPEFFIRADGGQLAEVFGHLIQNAQEATPNDGEISVSVMQKNRNIQVVIKDNGIGMAQDFVDNELFKPFATTKGLSGMGIGAHESREYIRSLGGDIFVESTRGEGSCFYVILPPASINSQITMSVPGAISSE